jgi:hypothetical protein
MKVLERACELAFVMSGEEASDWRNPRLLGFVIKA